MIHSKYTINSINTQDFSSSDISQEFTSDLAYGSRIYKFETGGVEGILWMTPDERNQTSFVVFTSINTFVPSLDITESNFDAYTFFKYIMAGLVHHKNITGIKSLTYKTDSIKKHRIYQMVSKRVGIPSVNECTEEMTEEGSN